MVAYPGINEEAAAVRAVVGFDQTGGLDRSRLGGKGHGLAEMTAAGVQVPPGFVITTDAWRWRRNHGDMPPSIIKDVDAALARLERSRGQRLGDPSAPLLVSVRSGAPVSMPGMLDTVLNLGITPAVRDAIAEQSDPMFAWEGYRRFVESFGSVVLGVPVAEFDAVRGHATRGADDAPVAVDGLQRTVAAYELLLTHRGLVIPDDPRAALDLAIHAVFDSWDSERACHYRQMTGVSDDLGTAVTVQAMVFGNRDDRSATGVLFTRDPNTGEPGPYGDVLFQGQGEDVVSGRHTTQPIIELRRRLPEAWAELWSTAQMLEHHFGDMLDIEFTVESGEIFLLQARAGKRATAAASRIASDLDREGIIDSTEAERRVAAAGSQTAGPELDPQQERKVLTAGVPAAAGVGAGELCLTAERAHERSAAGACVVLVRPETSPNDVHGMAVADAVVTARGGLVSHAAVTARELGTPTVVGASDIEFCGRGIRIGELSLVESDALTVDGGTGDVLLGDLILRQGAGMTDQHADVPAEEKTGAEEIGTAAGTEALLILHVLRVKGMADADAVARSAGVDPTATAQTLEDLAAADKVFFRSERVSGWTLTAAGRAEHATAIVVDSPEGREVVAAGYDEFCDLNKELKQLCTDWQLRPGTSGDPEMNPHDDPAYDNAVLDRVEALRHRAHDLLGSIIEQVPRFGRYREELSDALRRCREGDHTALTRPMSGSFHDIWMELHEDLLVSLGSARGERDGG